RMRRDMMERGNIQRRHGRREEKEGENEGDGITRTMIVDGDKKRSDSETESGSYTEESGSGSGNNNVDGATLVINSGFPMKKKKRRKKKIKIQPKFKYHGADLIKKKPKFSSLRQYSKDERQLFLSLMDDGAHFARFTTDDKFMSIVQSMKEKTQVRGDRTLFDLVVSAKHTQKMIYYVYLT
ncbi:hypothetical protein ADUPG1_001445, partial [Aduncisulcus paluster]